MTMPDALLQAAEAKSFTVAGIMALVDQYRAQLASGPRTVKLCHETGATYDAIREYAQGLIWQFAEWDSRAAPPAESSRALEAQGTPSAQWRTNGEPDPHGARYNCERAALAMGHMTDDEFANELFLHGDERPSVEAMIAGTAFRPIVWLTAAKDRIRWLSRKVEELSPVRALEEAPQPLRMLTKEECDTVTDMTAHDTYADYANVQKKFMEVNGLALVAAPADHLPAANGAKAVEAPSSRFVVKKEIGSEWARVIDTQMGMQVARYNVMPRKRSTRDGWKEADNHAAKLNAAAAAVLDTQREEGK